MTLLEAKAKVLALIDESTGDPDIDSRMNIYFDTAQKNIAIIKPIIKYHTITYIALQTDYVMPSDFNSLRSMRLDGVIGNVGYWVGKTLVLPTDEDRVITIEYNAYPTNITSATADSYVFEVETNAQECMPYWVAAQQTATDLSIDSNKYMMIYSQIMQMLNINSGVSVVSEHMYEMGI